MGIKDRLGSAKRYLWSPQTVWLLERGSDPVVRAGGTGKVVVDVEGENDGSCTGVEVQLVLNHSQRVWLLGELPAQTGHHELPVEIPDDAPPSSKWTQYHFKAIMHRTKGTEDDGISPVHVIGDPAHLYWPEGPRSGSEAAGLSIALADETVDAGGAVNGHVTALPGTKVKVEVGPVIDAIVHVEGRSNGQRRVDFKPIATLEPDAGGSFRAEIPQGVPPTFHDGTTTSVVWEVRATADKATAWARFGLLDPDGTTDIPRMKSSGLLDLFDGFV